MNSDNLENALKIAQIGADTQRFIANKNSETQRYAIENGINKKGSKEEQVSAEQNRWANRMKSAFAEFYEAANDPNLSAEQKWAAEGKYNEAWDEMLKSGAFPHDHKLLNYYRSMAEALHQSIKDFDANSQGKIPLPSGDY